MESADSSVVGFLTSAGSDPARSAALIEAFLDEQQDLTAVERFAQLHDDPVHHGHGRHYSALLPGRAPRSGEQYAFEVDLDRCSGCKACVAACHSLNGLDDGEAWREVGLLVGGPASLNVLQHVTSACHHCLDPACLNACPVDAYEKDPVTGIVKHLDDQCFGCQYCTLACPYDAPKFHAGKGIVRKCDMCADRLKVGEAPACVQGCPHEAIKIRLVDRAEVVAAAESKSFLPAAPEPSYTLPTTRYVSQRPMDGPVRAADYNRNVPEHVHVSLVLMLVLTQASVGGYFAEWIARITGMEMSRSLAALSLALGLTGIGASLFHLGRPLYAYRALIGLRHSWLSREVAAFGLFACLAIVHAVALSVQPDLAGTIAGAVTAVGAIGIVCSVMVYHVVQRPFWHAAISGMKFAGTAAVTGLALAFACSGGTAAIGLAFAAAALAKIATDARVMTHLRDPRLTPLRRSASLIGGPLSRIALARIGLGMLGGFVFPLVIVGTGATMSPATRMGTAAVAALIVLGGELAERVLFFAAVVRPKMPGGLPS